MELPKPDLAAIRARKDGVGNDIAMGMAGLLSNNKVKLLQSVGKLAGPGKVECERRNPGGQVRDPGHG